MIFPLQHLIRRIFASYDESTALKQGLEEGSFICDDISQSPIACEKPPDGTKRKADEGLDLPVHYSKGPKRMRNNDSASKSHSFVNGNAATNGDSASNCSVNRDIRGTLLKFVDHVVEHPAVQAASPSDLIVRVLFGSCGLFSSLIYRRPNIVSASQVKRESVSLMQRLKHQTTHSLNGYVQRLPIIPLVPTLSRSSSVYWAAMEMTALKGSKRNT